MPPDIDRSRGNSENAPGHENDHDKNKPTMHDNPNAKQPQSDRPDRATPPANTNTDDRTRKADDKKAGKDKDKKNEKY